MKKKRRKLNWNYIIKNISGLMLIATALTLITVSCHHAEAKETVQEEPTETATEMQLECFKYVEDVPLPFGLQTHINKVCKSYEIAPEIVFSMIEKESNYNHKEIGDEGNSYGLMQVQLQWHEKRMDKLGCDDLLNPYDNVLVGVDYLAELLDHYEGNLEMALTAYNAGPTGAYEDYFAYGIEASEYTEEVLEKAKTIDEGAILVFHRTDDPVADQMRYDAEQQKELEKCPKCSICCEYIQDDYLYEINDELICEECINDNFRKNVEDYIV